MGDFLSTEQAAEILGITRARVSQLIADGRIPTAGKVGRNHVLDRATIERMARDGWPGRRSSGADPA